MKKLLAIFLLLAPSLSFADRLGSINSNTNVALSTQSILNQSTIQTATFYVTSGAVQGPFRVIQSDDDTGSGPMIIASTFTKEADTNRYHSAYLYGIVPDPTNNNGEFVITMSSQTPFIPDKSPDYTRRPEIVMQQNNGSTGDSSIALRADTTINLPNHTPAGTFVVLPSTSINYGQLQNRSLFATQTPLRSIGAASQSAPLATLENSSQVIVSSFGADGNLYVATVTIAKAIKWPDGTIQISSPTGGGGSPGGSNGQIQYNNSGSFAGSTYTWKDNGFFYVSGTGDTAPFPLHMQTDAQYPIFIDDKASNHQFYVENHGASGGTIAGIGGINFVTGSAINLGAGGSAAAEYFQDPTITKGFLDNGISATSWMLQERAAGNTSLAIREAGSQTGDPFELRNASFGGKMTWLDVNGIWNSNGIVLPALTSCGSGPSITGTDEGFTITPGSGAGGCTATFGGSYSNAPSCTVSEQTQSLVNALSYTESSTALTLTQTSFSSKTDVICKFHG